MINEEIIKAVKSLIKDGKGQKFCASDLTCLCDEKLYTIRRNLVKMQKQGWLKTNWEPWMNGDTKFYSVCPDRF